jgi:hypothetical protein
MEGKELIRIQGISRFEAETGRGKMKIFMKKAKKSGAEK